MTLILLWWPIVVGDTDVWFHLSYGKYVFDHHAVPSHSYFSFLDPPAKFVHQSWLFSVVAYWIHSHAGYLGLILLRSAAYLVTVALILRSLLLSQPRGRANAWTAFVFAVCCLTLIPRGTLVRPHLVTYGLIAAFLFILEHRPRRALWLPVLGVLWSNLHGITYPVMALICLAYGAEIMVAQRKGSAPVPADQRALFASLILTLATPFANPHHVRLLALPFAPMGYESSFTMELAPLSVGQLLSFGIVGLAPSYQTVFNVLLCSAGLSVIAAVTSRRARVSHLLLCLGGALLLIRGVRFMNEFMLLSLPLLSASPPVQLNLAPRLASKPVRVVVAGLLMLMPALLLRATFRHRPAYPLSTRNLPQGVVTFLTRIDAGGALLNFPNSGGYLRWMLYPKHQIFMDMEIFDTQAFHLALHAFRDPEALRKTLTRYDPSFITVPLTFGGFPELLQPFPEYVPVFFDDTEALYVNARQYPAIARQHALRDVDPFQLIGQPIDAFLAEERTRGPRLAELQRLLAIYPECGLINQLMALASNHDQAYEQALPFADAVIRTFPESPTGYLVKGDSLRGLKRFREAVTSYRAALARSGEGAGRNQIEKQIGWSLLDAGRPREAYRVLKHAVDVFAPETSLEDAYRFGVAARLAGERKIAEAVLVFLQEFKVPPEDAEWAEKIRTQLAEVERDREPGQGGAGR